MSTPSPQEEHYAERVYAGVLGKLIGVYLGRPVEGWPYADIQHRFGLVERYVSAELGLPLIVADDDISATFAFGRTVPDNAGEPPTAERAGRTWLNYIVEDRTILWWGGLGRSTEHTAYLNLRAGVPAPRSGSTEQNGSTLAEQIGAQIFNDAFALMLPGDPERAVALTRAAASVSHDGDALDAAALLAAMRSLAFGERDLGTLLDAGTLHIGSATVLRLVEDVRAHCGPHRHWREIRDWVDERYGYAHYPGPCHSLANLAMTLGALLGAGDDFARSVAIASSAGFDTDSNAGVVGCLNGVRLGLDALSGGPDLRTPVADRLLVVTADGGECVSDATLEADRIVAASALLAGGGLTDERPRFRFRYPGSVQGFTPCPHLGGDHTVLTNVSTPDGRALRVEHGGHVSTPVFLDPAERLTHFSTVASPTLYPGQRVVALVSAPGTGGAVRPYALYESAEGVVTRYGDELRAGSEPRRLAWEVPAVGNLVPFRFGLAVAEEQGAAVLVHELGWAGAPVRFGQSGILLGSIWDTTPPALRPWVSSAKHFEADFAVTYSVSHPGPGGVVTIGTRDWRDYTVASRLLFSLHDTAGLVVRARGHRRFHAGVFTGGDRVALVREHDGTRTVLAERPFPYDRDRTYDVRLGCAGTELALTVDGTRLLTAHTTEVLGGAAGFLIDTGTMLADGFHVTGTPGTGHHHTPPRKAWA
ncbi:ADP-ribosylglycohydrolase family protein [Prauserella flavalba]|uniref:ADP-ribosylglycohydrolase family protein n=1 Tax=Prauserella flavalba TaxID=1477506 RepID=UPI0036EB3CA7